MSDFDWVTARAGCSLKQVFDNLRLGVQADVETRQKLREHHEGFGYLQSFSFASKASRFSASVDYQASRGSVIFVLLADRIAVLDENNEELFNATVTLNNEKQCMLVVEKEEMEEWQFRKKALEVLFFSESYT